MQKTITPTYLSLIKLGEILNIYATRNYTQIDSNVFKNQGFSKIDSNLAIYTSQFLGFITQDGKTTEKAKALQLGGEEKILKLREIVHDAYKDVFKIIPNIGQLSRTQLQNDFLNIYALSPRTVEPAVRAFLWLCTQAEIPTLPSAVIKPTHTKRNVSTTGPISTSSAKRDKNKPIVESELVLGGEKMQPSENFTISILGTAIRVILPKNEIVEDALAAGEFIEVRNKIIEFSKKINMKRSIIGEG